MLASAVSFRGQSRKHVPTSSPLLYFCTSFFAPLVPPLRRREDNRGTVSAAGGWTRRGQERGQANEGERRLERKRQDWGSEKEREKEDSRAENRRAQGRGCEAAAKERGQRAGEREVTMQCT
eukprot:3045437-Rhodomonas_salina.1